MTNAVGRVLRCASRVLVAVIATLLIACQPTPPAAPSPTETVLTPERAGLIVRSDQAGQIVTLVLEGSAPIDFNQATTASLTGNPIVGDVVLWGTQPRPWILRAGPRPGPAQSWPDGCYSVFSRAYLQLGRVAMVFHTSDMGDVRVIVPTTSGFTDFGTNPPDGLINGTTTCLNRNGAAFTRVG